MAHGTVREQQQPLSRPRTFDMDTGSQEAGTVGPHAFAHESGPIDNTADAPKSALLAPMLYGSQVCAVQPSQNLSMPH